MAGAGFKTFTAGSILTASDVNSYLVEQSCMRFATTTARDAAITAPSEGMQAYTDDTDSFWYYSGSAWLPINKGSAWTSYTPTLTNATLGNGTISGSYIQQGKFVAFRVKFTLGSTSTVTGSLSVSLPLAVATGSLQFATCLLLDSGVSAYPGVAELSSSTAELRAVGSAGTYATQAAISGTVPFTWGNTDIAYVHGIYEAQ